MTSIILVNPQMGENIGAAARVMWNFGLSDLRLVNPRDGWPNPKASAMAAGAVNLIENARCFSSVEASIADLEYVIATTARLRDMEKPIYSPESAYQQSRSYTDTGFLFGGEKSGLSNNELIFADGLCVIPTTDNASSLNLAQSVAIIAYQHHLPIPLKLPLNDTAPKAELTLFIEDMVEKLEQTNFFRSKDKKSQMVMNIKNLYTKSQLTSEEINTLRGIQKMLFNHTPQNDIS